MFYTVMRETPVGSLLIVGDQSGLKEVLFSESDPLSDHALSQRGWNRSDRNLKHVVRQLSGYFHGRLRHFDLPLAPEGTPFQQRVWNALLRVPWGETASYGQIAAAIGQPQAARAVGMANGRNPIPIVVPCHRIIGSDGSMVGYGGGLSRKEVLLQLEGALVS